MLTIRLSRVGKKNKSMYRLVISEKARDPYGRALEILGSYDPSTKELQVNGERIKYWISKGSQTSPTVNNLLIEKGIIEGEKVKASKAGKKKKVAKEEAKEAPKEGVATPEKTEEKPKDLSAQEGEIKEEPKVKAEKKEDTPNDETDKKEEEKSEEK